MAQEKQERNSGDASRDSLLVSEARRVLGPLVNRVRYGHSKVSIVDRSGQVAAVIVNPAYLTALEQRAEATKAAA